MEAKRLVEALLVRTAAPMLRRSLSGRGGVVLAFHNIVPMGERPGADQSLHLPQEQFAGMLDRVTRTHDVVPLAEILSGGPSQRPRLALTFDDGSRGMLTAGVRELARRGLPATCFVVPGRMGGPAFWWDRWSDGSDRLSRSARDLALVRLQGKDTLVDEHGRAAGWVASDAPSHAAPASEGEVREAGAYDRLDFGAHSWTHPNLAALEEPELTFELVKPLEWLAESGLRWQRWLAYPYGLTSAKVAEAAQVAGYQGALLVGHRPPPDLQQGRFSMPRGNIPAGASLDGFELRAAGLRL